MAPQSDAPRPNDTAEDTPPRRLFVYAAGLIGPGRTARRVARILTLAGLAPRPGWPQRPGPDDLVGVWGHSPRAPRGEAAAAACGAALVRIEDAFLRSVRPGRAGDPPLGLMIDRTGGVHFDASRPSALEVLLATHPLDDTALMDRARNAMARMAHAHLSKYNLHDPRHPAPPPGYVLVVDQTAGDASVSHGGVQDQPAASVFRDMLVRAQSDNPGARILIRSHPETLLGLRPSHFGPGDAGGRVSICTDPVAPQALLGGAIAVYTVSSQLGFEAILAGHRPVVAGRPFYAGWGLTDDICGPLPRRGRRLTRAQLFAATMILAPTWYDPCRDSICSLEDALDQLEAEVRAFREDRAGHVGLGMRLWKRPALQAMFGRVRPMRFAGTPARACARARATGRGILVWAGREPASLSRQAAGIAIRRVEDGFLRSRGLGAALVPALSLVTDDLGIYYDPRRESRLERLIGAPCPPGGERRAERLMARLVAAGLGKYNTGTIDPALPAPDGRRRILVPGQVEDDASVLLGGGDVRDNLGLLERVRADNPDAMILWKPHPDVEAGLRRGTVVQQDIARLCDVTLAATDAAAAIAACDEVWTITSGLGFEALLRGRPVTCLGMPFYAGWGLTRDLCPAPPRRQARPSLAALAHAVLIAYPRYLDPLSGLPCPPEVIAERLATGSALPRAASLRMLARLQGIGATLGLRPRR